MVTVLVLLGLGFAVTSLARLMVVLSFLKRKKQKDLASPTVNLDERLPPINLEPLGPGQIVMATLSRDTLFTLKNPECSDSSQSKRLKIVKDPLP